MSNVRVTYGEGGGRTLTASTHSAFSPCVKIRHSLRVSSLLHFLWLFLVPFMRI